MWALVSGRIYRYHVGMLDGNRVVDFTLKSSACLGVFGELGQQDFHCYAAAQGEIVRFVDGTHAALAQQPQQPEVAQFGADQWVATRHVPRHGRPAVRYCQARVAVAGGYSLHRPAGRDAFLEGGADATTGAIESEDACYLRDELLIFESRAGFA